MQHTLATPISCDGISLHQGEHVTLTLRPAPENHGITFKRTDIDNHAAATINAHYAQVVDTRLCTVLENGHGARISTVEHVMAALWGAGIDNAIVEVSGAEVPIMDGSADAFSFVIECAGVQAQHAARKMIVVDAPIIVQEGESIALLRPSSEGFSLSVDIAFDHAAIGEQHYVFDAEEMSFKQTLSRARTFGFLRDVEAMRRVGLARGGSLHNAVVLNDDGVMNEDGLRYHDECVRHKALDCLGDYFLSGHRLIAEARTSRPGHGINNKLIKALFANPQAWHYTDDAHQLYATPAFTQAMQDGQEVVSVYR
jgi:UDP-3-O-[3-hydroxymyristoyl] N-acetylglucosamine deacetylase